MSYFKDTLIGKNTPSVRNDDNVYFELHKLDSEQKRLRQMRANLAERIRAIDGRLEEIVKLMEAMIPKS